MKNYLTTAMIIFAGLASSTAMGFGSADIDAYDSYKEPSPGSDKSVPVNLTIPTAFFSKVNWDLKVNGQKVCEGREKKSYQSNSYAQRNCTVSLGEGNHTLELNACRRFPKKCSSASHDIEVTENPWDYIETSDWEAHKADNAANGLGNKNIAFDNTTGKRIGAYYTNWSVYARQFYPKDIPVENLTHIYHAFIGICGINESWIGVASTGGYNAFQNRCAGRDHEVELTDVDTDLRGPLQAPWINGGTAFDNTVSNADPIKGIFAEYYRMKQVYPHIKILPSIGGHSLSDPFFEIAADASKRKIFIDSVINFVHKYDFFDGVDLDWEFPGGGGPAPELASEADGTNFAILVSELRSALDELEQDLGRPLELHAAVGVSARDDTGGAYLGSINWEAAAQHLDYINLMTYDYRGAWNSVYGHHTPLYESDHGNEQNALDGLNADDGINLLLSRGVPASKMSVGITMYGRGWVRSGIGGGIDYPQSWGVWEEGIIDYKGFEKHILPTITDWSSNGLNGWGYANVPGSPGARIYELKWDSVAKAHMYYQNYSGILITYDSGQSVYEKANYALSRSLGGVFAWSIDGDSGTLLNSAHMGFGHPLSQ